LKLEHPTTHKFPDLFSACCLSGPAMAASWLISGWLDAAQIGPQCGGRCLQIPWRTFRILSSKLTTLSRCGKAAAEFRVPCFR
jgi:hypothetical protein